MTTDALYTYGVIEREDAEFDVNGVEGVDRAYTVDYRTLSAIVSEIGTVEPEETDENSRAHDDVLQTVIEERTVVPMRFGMAFKNEATLKSVLRGARPAFTRALREVDGALELGLKLVEREEATVDREAVREDVADRLDHRARSVVENDLFSDRLVLNRSYLVDRSARERFDDAVAGVEEDYDDLIVQYTGPWAPYNFVDIEIGGQ